MADIKITIGGDASGLTNTLKSAQAELVKTGVVAKDTDKTLNSFTKTGNVFAATLPAAIGKTTDALKQTTTPVVTIGKGIEDIGKNSEGASSKMTVLASSLKKVGGPVGEIAEHAHKLAEGFEEAGLAGLAIAGISIGVHLLKEAFEKSAEAAKKNKEEIEANKKIYEEVVSTISQEAAKVDIIVSSLKNETLSRKEKTEAIKELQKISPQYFNDLSIEQSSIEQITRAYNLYNDSLTRSITAKVREKQLEGVITKILELEDKKNTAQTNQIVIGGKLVKVQTARMQSLQEEQSGVKNSTLLTNKENDELQQLYLTRKKLSDLVAKGNTGGAFEIPIKDPKKLKTVEDILKNLKAELDALDQKGIELNTDETKGKIKALEETIKILSVKFGQAGKDAAASLYPQLNDLLDNVVKKTKKVETISSVLKKLRAELDALSTKELQLHTDEAKGKISALEGAIKELSVKFGGQGKQAAITLYAELKPLLLVQELKKNIQTQVKGSQEPIKIEPLVIIDPVISDQSAKTFSDRLQRQKNLFYLEGKGVGEIFVNGVKKGIDTLNDIQLDKAVIDFDKRLSAIGDAFKSTVTNIGSDALIALGQALAGGDVKGLFNGLIGSIGEEVENLGKALIRIGVEYAIAKKAFNLLAKSPGAAIIAGVGLVILGEALKKQVQSKNPGFASGTTNFQGGVVTVGERGPENIFLPNGSRVQPNNELQAYGGGMQPIVLDHRISGTDIVIVQRRAEAQMNRNGGIANYGG